MELCFSRTYTCSGRSLAGLGVGLALLLGQGAPADAQPRTVTVTRDDCSRLVRHVPAADATYRPGTDVYGRQVAPADLNGGSQIVLPETYSFEVEIQPIDYQRRRQLAAQRAALADQIAAQRTAQAAQVQANATAAAQLQAEAATLAAQQATTLATYEAAAQAIITQTGGPTQTNAAQLAARTAQLATLRTNTVNSPAFLDLQERIALNQQAQALNAQQAGQLQAQGEALESQLDTAIQAFDREQALIDRAGLQPDHPLGRHGDLRPGGAGLLQRPAPDLGRAGRARRALPRTSQHRPITASFPRHPIGVKLPAACHRQEAGHFLLSAPLRLAVPACLAAPGRDAFEEGLSMRLSRYFLPTSKDTPKEAEIVSHRLMLRAGMVRQASAGIYSWLPLGYRVLKKVEQIVREEQDRAGAQEVLMPTIQSADLWKKSGRYDDYGKEMLRITDRHEREMLYGPTNEELITDIMRASVPSPTATCRRCSITSSGSSATRCGRASA